MADTSNTPTVDKNALYIYRLAFGNSVMDPGTNLEAVTLEQSTLLDVSDAKKNTYSIVLHGVKVNKKIYQPTEIEVELDFMQKGSNNTTTAPSFNAVSAMFLQRQVKVVLVHVNRELNKTNTIDYGNAYTVAENCYVYELNPQLRRDTNGTKMFVKLKIFSMDKLMTLNKYSKAYVASKLGSGILVAESPSFGLQADKETPQIQTDITGIQFLKYSDSITYEDSDKNSHTDKITQEFIQPYLVQYNESLYDFLVRTANRCGEFLFFENGKLTLGLPLAGDTPYKIDYYESVTRQDISDGPFRVYQYARDSMKDGVSAPGDFNFSAIAKESTHYPKDAFPSKPAYNCETDTEEYLFPLYKGKWSSVGRELYYDGPRAEAAVGKIIQVLKSSLADKTEGDPTAKNAGMAWAKASVISPLVSEAVNAFFSSFTASGKNLDSTKKYIESLEKFAEQADKEKAVQFGSLDSSSWITVNYYDKIHRHQADQQRQIICINMGTGYAPVKLGQPIEVDGLTDTYIVIQIQQVSEEAWDRDYDTYGSTSSDKYSGKRSQKIYAIPAFKESSASTSSSTGTSGSDTSSTDTKVYYYPPVHPVPIIRHSGPQTAFVTDNEDPKFQGRVRIAYPWQSIGDLERRQLSQAEKDLSELRKKKEETEQKTEELSKQAMAYKTYLDAVKAYLGMSSDDRKTYLDKCETELEEQKTKKTNAEAQLKKDEERLPALPGEIAAEKDAKKRRNLEVEQVATEQDIPVQKATIAEAEAEIERLENTIKYCKEAEKNEKEQKSKDSSYTIDKNKTVVELTEKYDEATKAVVDSKKELSDLEKAVADQEKAAAEARAALQEKIAGYATPWIRIATPMATDGGGFYYKPRIGDEVLVNYDSDNIERPYVVGTLYSKNTLQPAEGLDRYAAPKIQQGKNLSMSMMSPNGHHITFTDPGDGMKFIANLNPGAGFLYSILPDSINNLIPDVPCAKDLTGGIHIGDRYGVYEIQMSSHAREISINSALGKIKMNAFTGISINAPNGDISITGQNINIAAGNKLSITSGNNILPPDIGDPDFEWKKIIEHEKWQDYFKIPFRAIGKAGHWFGHTVILAGAQAGAAVGAQKVPLADLCFFRCMLQTFMRPIDGTMLIKSKKYMMLEAGSGTAMVNPDHYKGDLKDKAKREAGVVFNSLLIKGVTSVNTKVNDFVVGYNDKWKNAKDALEQYITKLGILENGPDPDMIKYGWERNPDQELPQTLRDDIDHLYDGKLTAEAAVVNEENTNKRNELVAEALNLVRAIYTFHKHVKSFEHLFDLPQRRSPIDDCLKAAFDKAKEEVAGHLNGLTDTYILGTTKDETFNKHVKLLKRKIVAHYLLKVSESDANSDFNFITICYNEDDINESNLTQDYYWKRFILAASRGVDPNGLMGKLSKIVKVDLVKKSKINRLAQYNFLASALESLFGEWKKQFAADKWKMDVWDASQSGQLLISDNADATVHINSTGEQPQLEQEKDANFGNEKRLWKLVLGITNL